MGQDRHPMLAPSRQRESALRAGPAKFGPGAGIKRQGQIPVLPRRAANITTSTISVVAAALNAKARLERPTHADVIVRGQPEANFVRLTQARQARTPIAAVPLAARADIRARSARARRESRGEEAKTEGITRARPRVAPFDDAVTARLRQVAGARPRARITVGAGRASVSNLPATGRRCQGEREQNRQQGGAGREGPILAR